MSDVAEMGELPSLPERMGSYWSRQVPVDVVAIILAHQKHSARRVEWGQKPAGRDGIIDHSVFPWGTPVNGVGRYGWCNVQNELLGEQSRNTGRLPVHKRLDISYMVVCVINTSPR